MDPTILDVLPFDDFETASRKVLAYLHSHLGFKLWMMTRVQGNDWIVLQTEDHGYNINEGSVLKWADSFCSHMVLGKGPRVAPDSSLVELYANAPVAKQLDIGAYIGVPITGADGSLFGTLCAIDPQPQNASISHDLPLIELLAKLLSTIIVTELQMVAQHRRIKKLPFPYQLDRETGLLNRRVWDQVIEEEELIASRFGCEVSVIVLEAALHTMNIDKDSQQFTSTLKQLAFTLRKMMPDASIIARISDDLFAVLLPDCAAQECRQIIDDLSLALQAVPVKITFGQAQRHPERGLDQTLFEAIQDKEKHE